MGCEGCHVEWGNELHSGDVAAALEWTFAVNND